ncbi:MAG TPA: EamA family transporter [Kofleriaceae bacterium]|nr:EamA family transporter [Kofleriaceae bacterium]
MLRPMIEPRTRSSALVQPLLVLLWSTGFIGARLALPHAEPLTFLGLSFALVIVAMGAFVLRTGARRPRGWRQLAHVAIGGTLTHGVYLGGVFLAIHRGLPVGLTALVVAMQPLLTAVCASWLRGPSIDAREWASLGLGLVGVVMVGRSMLQVNGVAPAPAALAPMLVPAVAALLGITVGTLHRRAFCPRFDLATGVLDLLTRKGRAVDAANLVLLVAPTTALLARALFGEPLSAVAAAGMVVALAGVWLPRPGPGVSGHAIRPAPRPWHREFRGLC